MHNNFTRGASNINCCISELHHIHLLHDNNAFGALSLLVAIKKGIPPVKPFQQSPKFFLKTYDAQPANQGNPGKWPLKQLCACNTKQL